MSTKHVRTGADLVRFGASIMIDCRNCGLSRILTGAEFAKECGIGSLGAIAKHLQCSGCGGKFAQVVVLPPT